MALLPTMLTGATAARDVALECRPRPPRPASTRTTHWPPPTVALDAGVIAAAIDGLKGPETRTGRAPSRPTTTVDDLPGIIAIDLAAATELLAPARLSFDDAGRLVSLTIVARNTNLEIHDLVVETLITFRYPDRPPELPRPEPAYVAPAPAADEE